MGDLFYVNQKSKMASTTRHIWQKTILLKNKKVCLIWKTFKSFGRKISWIVPWIAFYQMMFFFFFHQSEIQNVFHHRTKFKIELWEKKFFSSSNTRNFNEFRHYIHSNCMVICVFLGYLSWCTPQDIVQLKEYEMKISS